MATLEPPIDFTRVRRPEGAFKANPILRWSPVVLGTALALYGARRRDLGGAALAMAGGALIYNAFTRSRIHPVMVRESFTIARPREEVYLFWRNFENLPRFMKHLESVKTVDSVVSQWKARGPAGLNVEWEAEITHEKPNELLAWRSRENSDIDNAGFVRFSDAPGGRGTEIYVLIEYGPPAGRFGEAFAKLFGEDPDLTIREDLRRFKRLVETGEIPTTAGQSSGRRGLMRNLEKSVRGMRNIVEAARTVAVGG